MPLTLEEQEWAVACDVDAPPPSQEAVDRVHATIAKVRRENADATAADVA